MQTNDDFLSRSLLLGETNLRRISVHPDSFSPFKISIFIVSVSIFWVLAIAELFKSEYDLAGVAATIETIVGVNMVQISTPEQYIYLKI